MFDTTAEEIGDAVEFHIVDSGFVHLESSPDKMPLTVLYKDGGTVDIVPFHSEATLALV